MVKRSKKKRERPIETAFWLLLSIAGGILFAFGLLGYFEEKGFSSLFSVIVGAVITFVALALNKFRTETSVALKKNRK